MIGSPGAQGGLGQCWRLDFAAGQFVVYHACVGRPIGVRRPVVRVPLFLVGCRYGPVVC